RIIIFCSDVTKLVRFYQDNFGLTVTGDPSKEWTVMNAGSIEIAFHKIAEQFLPITGDFKVDTNVKLVFETDTDIHSFRGKLLGNKVDIKEVKQFAGADYVVCDGRDPEGNVFQLMQKIK